MLHVFAAENALFDKLADVIGGMNIFGDPEQGMQVTQTAFTVLDIGFDHIAAFAGATVAIVALGQLRCHKVCSRAIKQVLAQPDFQLTEQKLIATDKAGLQHRGADRHVLAGGAQALRNGARGVANFQPHIPQHIEHVFNHALSPRRVFDGTHKHQIDIR